MKDEIKLIGLQLALGYSHEDIQTLLESTLNITPELAKDYIKAFYDSTEKLSEDLGFNDTKRITTWHVFMRQRLLEKAIQDATLPGLKLALAILDSLAQVQRITEGVTTEDKPITVQFLPVPPEMVDQLGKTKEI